MNSRHFVLLSVVIVILATITVEFIVKFRNNNNLRQDEQEYRINKDPILNRFPRLDDFKKCYWKAGVISNNEKQKAIGPTPYWIKGFIILYQSSFTNVARNYKWGHVGNSWSPSLSVEILGIKEFDWTYSDDYNNYVKPPNFYGKFFLDQQNGILYFEIER